MVPYAKNRNAVTGLPAHTPIPIEIEVWRCPWCLAWLLRGKRPRWTPLCEDVECRTRMEVWSDQAHFQAAYMVGGEDAVIAMLREHDGR